MELLSKFSQRQVGSLNMFKTFQAGSIEDKKVSICFPLKFYVEVVNSRLVLETNQLEILILKYNVAPGYVLLALYRALIFKFCHDLDHRRMTNGGQSNKSDLH